MTLETSETSRNNARDSSKVLNARVQCHSTTSKIHAVPTTRPHAAGGCVQLPKLYVHKIQTEDSQHFMMGLRLSTSTSVQLLTHTRRVQWRQRKAPQTAQKNGISLKQFKQIPGNHSLQALKNHPALSGICGSPPFNLVPPMEM